jgi:chloramphenicol-sensitive protein RarD
MKTQKTPDLGRGFSFGLSAYLIWGSFPLVISLLSFASPFEVVAWRIIFGFAVAVALIAITRSFKDLLPVLRQPKLLGWLISSTFFIMINWQVFVIAVAGQQILESSLGYFINPLVTILLAVVFLKEKLRPLQWLAVGFGATAVILLSFDYGRVPWLALLLAASFAIYGLAKNKLGGKVSAINSFAIESGLLVPVAAIQLLLVSGTSLGLTFGTIGFWGSAGFMLFGLLTAVPLIFFGIAAKHLPLSYIGFLQYLTPVLQFSLALLVFHEPMPAARWLGFGLVWLGLAVLTTDMFKSARAPKTA